jgi:hypothetical protein
MLTATLFRAFALINLAIDGLAYACLVGWAIHGTACLIAPAIGFSTPLVAVCVLAFCFWTWKYRIGRNGSSSNWRDPATYRGTS